MTATKDKYWVAKRARAAEADEKNANINATNIAAYLEDLEGIPNTYVKATCCAHTHTYDMNMNRVESGSNIKRNHNLLR